MPLAIELAAAWSDTLSMAAIAEEMVRDIVSLSTDLADVPPWQRSIRRSFDYSWQLLTPGEQSLFARLSVFQRSFLRQATTVVVDVSLRMLARLINKSLLRYDSAADRYYLHELLRQFGIEKLVASGELAETRTQHAHYYLETLAHYLPWLNGKEQPGALKAIRADMENVPAAWRWAMEEREITLLGSEYVGTGGFHVILYA